MRLLSAPARPVALLDTGSDASLIQERAAGSVSGPPVESGYAPESAAPAASVSVGPQAAPAHVLSAYR
jgi:hypothetical protein